MFKNLHFVPIYRLFWTSYLFLGYWSWRYVIGFKIGVPQSSIYRCFFHSKPSNFGYPHLWKPPYLLLYWLVYRDPSIGLSSSPIHWVVQSTIHPTFSWDIEAEGIFYILKHPFIDDVSINHQILGTYWVYCIYGNPPYLRQYTTIEPVIGRDNIPAFAKAARFHRICLW